MIIQAAASLLIPAAAPEKPEAPMTLAAPSPTAPALARSDISGMAELK